MLVQHKFSGAAKEKFLQELIDYDTKTKNTNTGNAGPAVRLKQIPPVKSVCMLRFLSLECLDQPESFYIEIGNQKIFEGTLQTFF